MPGFRKEWIPAGIRAAPISGGLGMLLAIVVAVATPPRLSAEEFQAGFEEDDISWRFDAQRSEATCNGQLRDGAVFHSGARSERVDLVSAQFGARGELVHSVPPAHVIDELAVRVWVMANHPGARLVMRLRFPRQIDPRTGEPLTAYLSGDKYTQNHAWQELRCQASEANLNQVKALLRAQLLDRLDVTDLDDRDLYVDEVRLIADLDVGETVIHIDDLRFGPIVAPNVEQLIPAPSAAGARRHRVMIGDDRLLLDDRPFFPIFLPYHGEDLELLVGTGANVIWTPDASDASLLQSIADAGMYVMAGVPPPVAGPGGTAAGLVPFGDSTAPVIFWNCGTRIPSNRLKVVERMAEQVRDADRDRTRLVWVDTASHEREVHRKFDVLGTSRFFLQTDMSPREYADYLLWKRQLALPGKPTYTFVQCEPEEGHYAGRAAEGHAPFIEPEQIQLQAWAAAAAGVKGIGFWTQSPLDGSDPATVERRLAITLFTLHARLLDRWLAAGKREDPLPVVPAEMLSFNAGDGKATTWSLSGQLRSRWTPLFSGGGGAAAHDLPIQATPIRSEFGLLVIPIWYEPDAQYQPGGMTARDLRLLVRPKIGTAQVYEVSTTGVRTLPVELEPVDGGTEVHLLDFDRHATLIITGDTRLVESLKQEVNRIRPQAAAAWIELAASKLTRVAAIHAELESLAPAIPAASASLAAARRHLEAARAAYERELFDESRRESARSLEMTRVLQRGHWDHATRQLSSPLASPHTHGFQTLPDHWRLMARIGRASVSDNLVPSGDFESEQEMLAAHWQCKTHDSDAIASDALLAPRPRSGRRCLRLGAVPTDPTRPPIFIDEPPVRMTSPPIDVYAGQIVHATGYVRVQTPVTSNPDGFVIYDSVKGTVGSQRWRAPSPRGEWQSFDLIREIREDGVFAVTLELRGLGEVWIDDFKLVAIDAPPAEDPPRVQPAAAVQDDARGFGRLLRR